MCCGKGGPTYQARKQVMGRLVRVPQRARVPAHQTRINAVEAKKVMPKIFNVELGSQIGNTIVQPQPEISPSTPGEEYPVDPSTGQFISVIKTGEPPCPPLTNTTAQPETFEIESPAEDSVEKKEE